MVAHHLVFLNRSYYCYECDRGFNTEDYEHHPCEGRKCVSCYRMNCPEFRRHEEPSGKSGKCLRSFYGEERTRLLSVPFGSCPFRAKSVCKMYKKFPDCCKIV